MMCVGQPSPGPARTGANGATRRVDHRRHRIHQAGKGLGVRPSAVHRDGRQDHQLPGRGQSVVRHGAAEHAARFRAVHAGRLGQGLGKARAREGARSRRLPDQAGHRHRSHRACGGRRRAARARRRGRRTMAKTLVSALFSRCTGWTSPSGCTRPSRCSSRWQAVGSRRRLGPFAISSFRSAPVPCRRSPGAKAPRSAVLALPRRARAPARRR